MPRIHPVRRSVSLAIAIVSSLLGVLASQPASAAPRPAMVVGSERSFWVIGSGSSEFDRVRATLVFDGRLARIWVDNRDTGRIDAAVLGELARGLESATPAGSRNPAKGIIENEQEVFGATPSAFKVGGKDDFLLFDIPNTAGDELTLLGYFHTKDQYSRKEVPSSNELNMLYIDSREGLKSVRRLLATIAHEYQHLIHFGRNPDSERFYTEAMSELATVMTGFRLPNSEYMAHTNSPLFRWSDMDATMSQVDYQRGMTLMRYLYEQYGERFIDEFVAEKGKGVARIENTLAAVGLEDEHHAWDGVLTRFAIANYLQDEGTGEYGYSDYSWVPRQMRPSVVDFGAVPAEYRPTRMRLEPYGTSYVQFDAPRSLVIDVDRADSHRVVALSYETGSIRVSELEPGVRYELGDPSGGVERVVLAYVSLSDRQQLIRTGVSSAANVSMN